MKQTLMVTGMTCEHCKKSVYDTLTKLDGVEDVNIDLDTGKVDVIFDESVVNVESLEEAVENQGYDVEN